LDFAGHPRTACLDRFQTGYFALNPGHAHQPYAILKADILIQQDVARAASTRLKRVASDEIHDSRFGFCVIHCGSKESRDGQAVTDGVA
jgi:hypothetical protein